MNDLSSAPTDSKPRSLLKTLLLNGGVTLLSALAALLPAEAAVRVFFPQDQLLQPVTSTITLLDPSNAPLATEGNPALGVMLKPRVHYLEDSPEFHVEVRSNSLGYREREWGEITASGKPVVVVTGDSFIWGTGAQREQRALNLIAARLRDYEWANLAMFATSTDQHYFHWREHGKSLNPVLVVEFVYPNDFRENLQNFLLYPKPHFRLTAESGLDELPGAEKQKETHQLVPLGFRRFLRGHSHLFLFLKSRLWYSSPDRSDIDIYLKDRPPAVRYKYDLLKAVLTRYAEEVRASGAQFAVVSLPDKLAVSHDEIEGGIASNDRYDLGAVDRELDDWGAREGVPVFSLASEFKGQERADDPLHYHHNGHWTPRGNRVIADLFLENIWPTLKEELTAAK